MQDFLLSNESPLRLGSFIVLLGFFLLLEALAPKRQKQQELKGRWTANILISITNTLLLRAAIPLLASAVALKAQASGFGLFNQLPWPFWLECLLGILLLDLVIYWQHRLFHRLPILWRLHRMHHSDMDIDTTTAVRFHPIEIYISMWIKIGAVLLFGVSAVAIILFEILLNACALFNHSNIAIPEKADKLMRLLIVTPDFHRIHHSIKNRETNSNYGFNFPWWDKLFGSYTDQPEGGQQGMTTGLEQYRDPGKLNFTGLLKQPLD